MPVLVTSNFEDDSIKNERASMETTFSHYKPMGNFRRSRTANSVVSGPYWPKFELVRDCMHVLVTCKYKKDRIKNNREKEEISFSPVLQYKSMGAFCCHGNQSLDPINPKTLSSLSPTQVMHATHKNLIKTGQLASEIFKSECVDDDGWTTDHWYTISEPSAQMS